MGGIKNVPSSLPETEYEKLNRFLLNLGSDNSISIERKIALINKFIEILDVTKTKGNS